MKVREAINEKDSLYMCKYYSDSRTVMFYNLFQT